MKMCAESSSAATAWCDASGSSSTGACADAEQGSTQSNNDPEEDEIAAKVDGACGLAARANDGFAERGAGGDGSGGALQSSSEAETEGEDEEEGDAVYSTLRQDGPQNSHGAIGHPEECTPCTFYCFAKRGCKRGLECKFCHLWHQSKLQLRREAWKQQQRLKRKALAQRSSGQVESVATRRSVPAFKGGASVQGFTPVAGGCGGAKPIALYGLLGGNHGERRDEPHAAAPASSPTSMAPGMASAKVLSPPSSPEGCGGGLTHTRLLATSPSGSTEEKPQAGGSQAQSTPSRALPNEPLPPLPLANPLFTYSPSSASFAVGQRSEIRPKLVVEALSFQALQPLPHGFMLDPSSGTLIAACLEPIPPTQVIIQAELAGGISAQATVQVEVVDFSCGGYVMGHLEELEPGKFMALLYVPKAKEGDSSFRETTPNGVAIPTAPATPPRPSPAPSQPPSLPPSPGHPQVAAAPVPMLTMEPPKRSSGTLSLGGSFKAPEASPLSPVSELGARRPSPWFFEGVGAAETWKTGWAGTTPEESSEDSDWGSSGYQVGSAVLAMPQMIDGLPISAGERIHLGTVGTREMPTYGSAGHWSGTCNPCAFVHKGGCQSGVNCLFCHLCDPGEKRRRKKERRGFQRSMMATW